MNAGDTRSNEQLCKATLRSRCAQWNAIEQNLVAGCTKEQARVAAFIKRKAQFLPRRFKLTHGAHMAEFVQPRKLEQDVQAAYERAGGRRSSVATHGLRRTPKYP